jgi:hypothetical protein
MGKKSRICLKQSHKAVQCFMRHQQANSHARGKAQASGGNPHGAFHAAHARLASLKRKLTKIHPLLSP